MKNQIVDKYWTMLFKKKKIKWHTRKTFYTEEAGGNISSPPDTKLLRNMLLIKEISIIK